MTLNKSMHYPLLFITSNLGGGGAERAMVTILNHLDRSLFQLHLALFQKEGPFLDLLASDVSVYEIQPRPTDFVRRNWTRLLGIQNLVQSIQPALIFSMLWQANAVTIIADMLWDYRAPIVINEQTAPRASLTYDSRRRAIWPLARRLYPRADEVVVISKGIGVELSQDVAIPAEKIHVIHNPVVITPQQLESENSTGHNTSGAYTVVSVGRLVPLKNYPMLLHAIKLARREVDVELYILGDGPEKMNIQILAERLGIAPAVHLLGFVPNPHDFMARADLFVLTSKHEGFGNVLIEAMASGVPVVATDCPYGPREILENGKYGVLVSVDDVDALAEKIVAMLTNHQRRKEFILRGRERAKDFSANGIAKQYKQLFLDVIAKHKK